MKEGLPEGWCLAPLSEVVAFNPGIDKSQFVADDELPFVPMPAVEAETGAIDVSARRPFSKVKSGFTAFATGDVLFAKITPCMENGKMAVVPSLPQGVGFGTTEFHVLRPSNAILAAYVYYFVSSSALRHDAQHHMTGAVGQKRVPKRYLEAKEVMVPPLNEQQRIVEKIETLFARLDKGEEAVREVQKLLKRYRQSILKSAVTGELTADWRAEREGELESGADLLERILKTREENWQGRGKYKVPVEPDTTNLPNLPEGWVWASVDQVTRFFGNGLSKKPVAHETEFPIFRISATRALKVHLDDVRYYQPADGEDISKFWVEKGDLLFTRYNGSGHLVGVCGLMRGDQPILHPDKLIKAKPVQERGLCSDYIELAWNTGETRKYIEQHTKTTSGQQGIAGADIKISPFPMPGAQEQLEIAEHVAEALAQTEKLEAHCETELKRSASLRQSILKDAFSGRLVPQSPDDESASALLERIQKSKKKSR